MTDTNALPMSDRNPAHLPGHWLLARLGKRVLRPGGRELTHRMLDAATLPGAEVVELAPGLGHRPLPEARARLERRFAPR